MNKYFFLFIFGIVFLASSFSSGIKEKIPDYSLNSYNYEVMGKLGNVLTKDQKIITKYTFELYQRKYNGNWDNDKFKFAVDQGVKNCKDSFLIGGIKSLKALSNVASDLMDYIYKWIEKNSTEYDENH